MACGPFEGLSSRMNVVTLSLYSAEKLARFLKTKLGTSAIERHTTAMLILLERIRAVTTMSDLEAHAFSP